MNGSFRTRIGYLTTGSSKRESCLAKACCAGLNKARKRTSSVCHCSELLQSYRIVQVKWRNSRFVQVLLSNSILVSFLVARNSGDVEKIFIDKSLCGKLTDKLYTGIWTDWYMFVSFCDKSKICCIHFSRKLAHDFPKLEKLAALEPKITYLDLPGHAGRRLHRHLTLNTREDMVGIWWSTASEEAWPWSPVAGDRARANIILVGVNGGKVDILGYLRTECDPIFALFSRQNPHHILTIESTAKNDEDNSIDSCIYEFHKNGITRLSATAITLKSVVSCLAWNEPEDKLLLGGKDKSLVLYDCHRLLTQITNISFVCPHVLHSVMKLKCHRAGLDIRRERVQIPSKIQWHPAGSVAFVFSLHGDIQVFDMALAPILLQLAGEIPKNSPILRISEFFSNIKLSHTEWSCDVPLHTLTDGNVDCHDNLILVFQDRGLLCNLMIELGSLTQGRLGPRELIEEYIKHNQAEQAVNFVNSINWNNDGSACFACLSAVMNYLLKFPLTDEREGLLEDTLGCFYTPSRPLTDVTVLQYRDPLSRWSRRFFYHLLRYRRFQKAFMLAVDIGAADLFMDIHFVALDAGNIALAENAKNKALEIDSELLSTESDDSSELDEEDILRNTHEEINEYQESYGYEEPKEFTEPVVPKARDVCKEPGKNDENRDIRGLQEQPTLPNGLDGVDGPAEIQQPKSNILLPLYTNITQDPDVWELANNIELVTTENEGEDVIFL